MFVFTTLLTYCRDWESDDPNSVPQNRSLSVLLMEEPLTDLVTHAVASTQTEIIRGSLEGRWIPKQTIPGQHNKCCMCCTVVQRSLGVWVHGCVALSDLCPSLRLSFLCHEIISWRQELRATSGRRAAAWYIVIALLFFRWDCSNLQNTLICVCLTPRLSRDLLPFCSWLETYMNLLISTAWHSPWNIFQYFGTIWAYVPSLLCVLLGPK